MPPKKPTASKGTSKKKEDFLEKLPPGLFGLGELYLFLNSDGTLFIFSFSEEFFRDSSHVSALVDRWADVYKHDSEEAILQLLNFLLHVLFSIILPLIRLFFLFLLLLSHPDAISYWKKLSMIVITI
jgi:hypothetical protein